jgi:hypothetical protein
MTALSAVFGVSWLVSAGLLVHLLRKPDPLLFKIGLAITLTMPILGPIMYLLIQGMPAPQDPDLQKRGMYRLDVLERWWQQLEMAGRLEPLRRWGDRKKKRKK